MARIGIDPEQLLRKGLLPENLPPVFHSRGLWRHFERIDQGYLITRNSVGQPATYNASKRGDQRRIFAIPHPAFVRDQALFLKRHWAELFPLIQASAGSASIPEFYDHTARHVRLTPHSELPRMRLQKFARFKYCLITDVSRFYSSVYTHSIPWAINGKAAAKADNSANSARVYGNRLDFLIRQSQSKQTIGIPVGPDASKITAEILMSAVDRAFIERSGANPPTFLRHVDDYWVGGNSYTECEKHLHNLRSALREYELDINESKTRIVSAKTIFGERWPHTFIKQLRDSLPSPVALAPRPSTDTLNVLNDLVELATSSGDDGIIRYALKKIDEHRLWGSDWPLLQDFVAQCAVQFPHSTDLAMRVAAWRHRIRPSDFDKDLWLDVAKVAAATGAALGRDSEVLWSLWMFKELGERVPKEVTDQAVAENGPLVLAFLAHCSRRRLTSDRRLKQKLWERVEGNPLAGQWWPLTLEMRNLGTDNPEWLQTPGQAQVIRVLHEQKASIIDWGALPRVFVADDDRNPDDDGEDPDYAIEDYGADYDEDDDEEEEGGAGLPQPPPAVEFHFDAFMQAAAPQGAVSETPTEDE